jgi:hypothetical protein
MTPELEAKLEALEVQLAADPRLRVMGGRHE